MVNCVLFDDEDVALQSNGSNRILTAPLWLLTQITGTGPKGEGKNCQTNNVKSDL